MQCWLVIDPTLSSSAREKSICGWLAADIEVLLDRVDDIVDADIDDIPMLMYDIVADIDDILMLMYDIVDDVDIWMHGDVRSNMLLSHPLTKGFITCLKYKVDWNSWSYRDAIIFFNTI